MVALRDSMPPLSQDFGVHTARNLILQHRVRPIGSSVFVTQFTTVAAQIETVSPRLSAAFQNSNIVLEVDDFQLRGISRFLTRDQLVDTGITYFVDGVLNADRSVVISGIECDFISITEETLTWTLILRRKGDHRNQ
jgi:hypothetical protein